jgi:hypothetical protein
MTNLGKRVAGFALVAGTAAAMAGLSPAAALAATQSSAPKTVTYLGYKFTVPATWSVVHVSSTSATCVNFDRHAIYLGRPGQNQKCPSGLLGTTEAVLVQPVTGKVSGTSAAQDTIDRQITVASPKIEVTATYDTNRSLVARVLASASLPVPSSTASTANAARSTTGSTARATVRNAAQKLQSPAAAAAALSAGATEYTGKGFDACTAPSSAAMSAWKSSPYRAVGIYIGGANRACSQPNLTASWVSARSKAGWHFLPTYLGPQADSGQLSAPASQAVAAAKDAVTKAKALGLGTGNVIYYDMEAFPSAQETKVLTFLSAWTKQLHAEGYKSGVYSSSASGIVDLARNVKKYTMPDAIWDALWNGAANTADPAIAANQWDHKQRAHQYRGGANATYGGHTINIDQDYLNIGV